MQTAIVIGREIKKNKDGKKSVIILQCQITDPEDIQSVELMNQSGEDNNPPNESRVTIIDIGQAYKIAIASDDNIEPITNPGEKRIYSTDSDGNLKASIYLKDDGSIREENDNGYHELKANGDVDINGVLIKANGDIIAPTKIEVPSAIVNNKELADHDHDAGTPPGLTGANN